MSRRRIAIAIIATIAALASCTQPAQVEAPEPGSLDRTIKWLVDAINEASNIHVQMGDKLVTHSAVVKREDRCVLSIHDKQHTQLGGGWQESDVRATLDLRQIGPSITSKEFRGSDYHGAVLTVSTRDGRAEIPLDGHFNSSGVGPVHTTDPAKSFDLMIADHKTAERIADALARAIDLCR